MGLKLLISPTITVSGLLDFDGINDYVRFSSNPIPTGTQNLTFKLYIKEIPSSSEIIIHLNNGAVNDLISIFLDSSGDLVVSRSGLTHLGGLRTNISSKLNQILEIEVQKTTGSIDAVLINGVDNSNAAANYTPYNGTVSYVSCGLSNFLGSAFIWDINLSDNHSWAGYPEGNLDSAWVDTIGAIDCSVYGSPDTIDITGYGGSGPIQNVLSIVPSVETYTGVGDFNPGTVTISSTDEESFGFSGNKVYRWKMWLDKDAGWANALYAAPDPVYGFRTMLLDSSIYFTIGLWSKTYSIADLDNQILDCVLYTVQGSPYVADFEVNGSIISASENIIAGGGGGSSSGVLIGSGLSSWDGSTISSLEDATVWEFSVETSTGTLLHSYKGYPAGDTLGAWVDDASDMDATANSMNFTRDIVGVNPGQGGETGSILLIDPPPGYDPNRDVLDFDGSVYIACPSTSNLSGNNVPISFYMYLDVSDFGDGQYIYYNSDKATGGPSTDNMCFIYLDGSSLFVDLGGSSPPEGQVGAYITDFTEQPVLVEIEKSSSVNNSVVDFIKFNGVAQDISTYNPYSVGWFNQQTFGAIDRDTFPQWMYELTNGTIWDIKTPGHHWKGYNNGNTNDAWIDQIGDMDASVITNPPTGVTPTTRTIIVPE